jgi:hypothetical protein
VDAFSATPVAGCDNPYKLPFMAQPLVRRMTTKEMLARPVSFDPTGRDPNLPVMDFIRATTRSGRSKG